MVVLWCSKVVTLYKINVAKGVHLATPVVMRAYTIRTEAQASGRLQPVLLRPTLPGATHSDENWMLPKAF